MKTTIFWVVGSQRSGKTTITTLISTIPNIKVVNIGEEIRKFSSVEEFKVDKNPYAPESLDEFVLKLINKTLKDETTQSGKIIVFDSSPRNMVQYNILIGYKKYGFNCIVVFINEKYEERLRRAKLKYNEQEMQYFHKRESVEAEWLIKLRRRCIFNEIDTFSIGCSIEEAYGNIDFDTEV